jgi:hypothetical protein
MCEGGTIKKARTPSSAFASELVICGLLMGLALGNLLSTFKFRSHSLGHYLLGCALAIVSVWYIHLLNVWKNLYEELDRSKLAWGGLLRLWSNVLYAGLLYLAFHYHYNYRWCLACLTAVVAVGFIPSALGYNSEVAMIRQISRHWVRRDMYLLFALIMAWGIHLLCDPAPQPLNDTLDPSVPSGFVCLGGVAFAYWYDLVKNPDFYGASWNRQKAV